MKISVAICTWNRAELLDQTLKQMANLHIPDGVVWELIVVDNNCSDHTSKVIDRHMNVLPIKKMFVRQQGLSHCRNAAIEQSVGEWILWTDDDVLVDQNWLGAYVEEIRANPGFAFAGGTIEPLFETKPPRWLNRHFASLEGAFAVIRRDDRTRPLTQSESIFGANMAFRSDVLKGNRFDTSLGLVGANSIGGEETELFERARTLGHRGLWVGSAKVQHYIPQKRMTTSYLWEFFQGYGRAITRMNKLANGSTIWGRPIWALRSYAVSKVLSGLSAPLKNSFWLRHFKHAATCAGIIAEASEIHEKVNAN